jgi:Domain of unknown function DUF1829/Domain of unknown function DUF1828
MSMTLEIEKLLSDYRAWLKDKTTLKPVDGGWVEITTPYLDRHNDALQIYTRAENGGYVLTDDSYTIHDLEASGCTVQTGKRQDLLTMTLNGFGVRLEKEALQVHATTETFPQKKHSLIQAMLAVNDLFYLAKPVVTSLFYEDVVAWLDANEIRCIQRSKLAGASGYDHIFDFAIPKSRSQPERIVQAITRPSRDTALTLINAWVDTRQVRPTESKAYAILNDMEQPVSANVLDALRNYQIKPVPFSRRAEVVTELAA